MVEFINAIPMELGWAIVGATAMLAIIMVGKVGAVMVEMIKARLADDEEEEA